MGTAAPAFLLSTTSRDFVPEGGMQVHLASFYSRINYAAQHLEPVILASSPERSSTF
jgi:hypothetical protein